ncbi:amino acid adenylation domain-containing protein [Roseomonas gilardii subsp. gilardii]|uniref:amino acid adenylation domain-containing protein n=1 Tax=Roseomonas gilardii TaxID=257708 RepID=UPI001FFBDFBB|nr:amino acid adenylation domain-containing protein [Roseomonas gilardii]UPG73652.1 amino acid adenylation domain-containing protein [Roseomonas gilardii subsp. gilardii]
MSMGLQWLGLTEAQAGLWYAQRLDPENPVFNTGQFIALRGKLDLDAFRAALSQAVAEAGALCLRFEERDGQPAQAVDPALRPEVEVIDLSGDPEGEAKARAAMRRDMDTPRGLKGEPLAAERIYRLGPERHLWYQRVHHLAVDAFGTELITRRTAALYAERLGGPEAGPPPPGLEAALGEDAVYRASPKREADAAYWREAMAGLGEVASLAPGAAASGHRAIRLARVVEGRVAERLRARAEATSLPWPDILSALIGAYVRRHAGGPMGSEEAAIGLGFMSRLGSPAARLPCMLMNVLPLRLPVPEEAPLDEFLLAAAKRFARARRHGRYRGEQIRRDLHRVGGRGGAGRRLYGALVNILPFEETPDFPGLATEIEILGTGPVDDITITLRGDARASRLRLELEANPALYDAAALAAHAERLVHFLGAALDAERLADVPTATPAEAAWALRTLNATAHPVPDTTLAALIERQMAGTPDAVALEADGERLTYAELERRSRALALELRARGAGPGRIVAVALERSLALEVALVAILRAGAAYLPLDLSHPPARIARILASAQPALVLAHAGTLEGLACLPPESWRLDSEATLPSGPEPGDLAYLLYTSGSTGEPKGVMVEHRAIVNRLEWMRRHYGFGPGDRILQKTPMTFDVSVWEFFLPLLSGGTLVMAPPGAHKDPAALAALIRDGGITTAHFVPSMLAAFLAEPAARGLSPARVFCSGEALPPELRDRFHATLRSELHNLYGPTEAAVDVSYWPAGPEDRSRPVPIGFPVWNTRLYVLDEALRPLPPGVAGQLFIAGRQLARGYLGRDDLTERAFIPDPFHPGERMYRTGDLASLRPDGAILFHGRADDQVKLRGLRIELGEIEAALATAPGVAQGRVVAREDRPGDQRLVAYLVPGEGYAAEAVRAHVAARVPDYMLPSAFVALESLPVNSSGKLDRRALPAPDYGREAASGTGREPATETERRLAALFAEALGLPRVGAEDDFFALGGHSLLAVELTLRIREEWGWDPGLGAVFEHPDVAGLARLIDAGARVADTGANTGLGPLIRLSDGDPALPPLFVVHPAGGLSWCYGTLARALSPRRVVYGIQAPALDLSRPLPESLEALAADYVARILAVHPEGVVHLLGWSVGGIIAQAMAVRLRALGHPVGLVALLDAYPADVWRDQPDPGPEGGLRALLAIAGHDPERLPPGLDLTREAVTAFLRQGDSPLGRLPEAALDGVVRVVQSNNRLVRGHVHGRFDGRLTHIRAARDHQARPEIRPDLWRPYAAWLEVLDMPALHQELVGERIVAQIAPLLAGRMARFEAGGESGCAAAE